MSCSESGWGEGCEGCRVVWSRLPSRRRATPVPADPERMARARPVLKALAIVYVLGLAAVVIVILQASRTAG